MANIIIEYRKKDYAQTFHDVSIFLTLKNSAGCEPENHRAKQCRVTVPVK